MRLPSFSKLDRVSHCPASAVLPQVESESEYAELGTAKHAYLAHPGTMDEALAAVPEEHRSACAAVDLDSLGVPRKAGAPEVSLAWDYVTDKGREIGQNLDRKYYVTDTEFHGTADWVALLGQDGVAVLDWKTGWMRVTPAARNIQLRAAALAACRAYGRSWARVAIVYVREGDEPVWDGWAELDALELEIVADELRTLVGRMHRAQEVPAPKVATGAHCRYCPAMHACPAFGGVLARLGRPEPMAIAEDIKALLTPETARLAYERRKMLGEVLSVVDAALKMYAREHPIALSNGQMYGPVERSRTDIDPRTAYRVLLDLYGPDVCAEAFELEATKASIGRGMRVQYEALKKTGQKPVMSRLTAEALAAIEQAGGLKKSVRSELREHQEERPADV